MEQEFIHSKGIRVNNLKNIDVSIPQGKLVVVTGVSGSGKSSLAFDTLYAEGRRRYVESLSSYARQFLGRLDKPEVDFIQGLPPAIAVEQKVKTRTSRSTVGTATEIYDYLRMLFARVGKTYSPLSGEEVRCHQVHDVLEYISCLPEGTRTVLCVPITDLSRLERWRNEGFSRVWVNGEFVRIEEFPKYDKPYSRVFLVVERLTVQHDVAFQNRLADSVQTAFYEGGGTCYVGEKAFSDAYEADGMRFEEPTDALFSFNSPVGACPQCQGFGSVIGIDEDLVVPDKSLSIYEDAIACWRGTVMGEYKRTLIHHADKFGFPIHKPYYELSPEQKRTLWTGNAWFHGLNDFFEFLQSNQYKVQYRVMLSRYRGRTVCPLCGGSRLRKEVLYVKVGGKNIYELVSLSIRDLAVFFHQLQLPATEEKAAECLLQEIRQRLRYLLEVGLPYLTLNRASNTLSGGESQRINLSTSLGSSLVGSLYVLDEPSIGLHPRDTAALIRVLQELRDMGNTVLVVEHEEAMMRAADWLVDIGPGAGRWGGQVVFSGPPALLLADKSLWKQSATARFLAGQDTLPWPKQRRPCKQFVVLEGVTQHNLKNITVHIPLHAMTVVTGVSGSGKSTLVRDVFYAALKRHFGGTVESVGSFAHLQLPPSTVTDIEFVDQNPIGKHSRSNPCIYVKAFDEIRRLYAGQPLAKQMGFTTGYFSYNSTGGRCEACQGEGKISVAMQFMADVQMPCEVCHGKRYTPEVLEVKYKGKDIHDVLEMTVSQAIEFFAQEDALPNKLIVKRLRLLQEVGLGYIQLGQSSNTLSGGENQRVKLAAFMAETSQPRIFVFDEPTTGLHFADIRVLMQAFGRLIESGHTVVIIEHNVDVIAGADYIVDLGPEGGDEGGYVVYEGTPEGLIQCSSSLTGCYVRTLHEKKNV